MPARIDHVIVAGRDFAALEAAWIRLGFFVTGGGTHPHLGTRNRIVVLGEGYVELLGVADPERVSPALTRRLAASEAGWVGFAVQSANIEEEASAMGARGVDARGPAPGRLVAPSGMQRSWRTVMVGADDLWAAAEPLPFLIQHDTTGETHRRELTGESDLAPHANGARQLDRVYVAVRDLAAAGAAYARAYDIHPDGASGRDAFLGAETLELPLAAGRERIVLAQPVGDGPARRRLDTAGDGLCAVAVAVADRGATEALLRERGVVYAAQDGVVWIDGRDSLGVPLALTALGR